MNPLIDMLLNMLKVAEYYNRCNPTAAKPLNDCISFYLNSTIPMISPIIREMKTKGLIDKAGRITQKGKNHLAKPLSKMNDGQLGVMIQDVFDEVMGRVNAGTSPHEFVVSGSDASYLIDGFCKKWSDTLTPFLDTTLYFEEDNQDEQIDALHQEPVEGDYAESYQYLQQ